MIRTLVTALSLAIAFPAFSHEFKAGDLHIDHPVVFKAFAKARAAGGYMSITNTGDTSDLLIGVRSDVPRTMIHESREDDGVMRMIHLDAVEIAAGETVSFKPGGLHVMFMGLEPGDLLVGEEVGATLIFERAGEVDVFFTVGERPADGKAFDHTEHQHNNS